MATTLQFRRGNTSQNDNFTGAEGEVAIDTQLDQLRLHDGSTQGGFKVARQVDVDDRMQVANAVSKTSSDPQSMVANLAIDSTGSTSGVHISNGAISIFSATGSPSYIDLYCEVTNAHRSRLQAPAHADFGGNITLTMPTTSGTIALEADVIERMQVANTQALHTAVSANVSQAFTDIQSTNTAIRSLVTTESGRVDNVLTSISGTNTAIRALITSNDTDIADRMQVANTQALVNARLGATASVALTGDITGSASFSGNSVSISTTYNNDVVLGTDTSGNYVAGISGTANEVTVSGSGSEGASVTIGLPNDVTVAGQLNVGENVIISGNLTVSGTQTTVNSNVVEIGDAVITLNSDLSSGTPASEDAGILINRGSDADVSFVYDETNNRWTTGSQQLVTGDHIPNTDSAEDLGTTSVRWRKLFADDGDFGGDVSVAGDITVSGTINASVTGTSDSATSLATPRSIGLGGDLSGSASFDGTQDITINATIQNNSVALGTDTSGNYVGTITGGTGIASSGATSGEGVAHTLSVDLSELTDMTQTMVGSDEFIVLDAGADRRKAASEIGLSIFNNDANFSTTTGTVTSHTVSAGNGLTGGGTVTSSGTTTVNVGAGTLIDVTADAVNVDLSELSTSTTDGDGDFFAVIDSSNNQKKLTKGNINISGFNNDAGFSTTTGTVTSVGISPGTGLDASGTVTSSGNISVSLDLSELTDMTGSVDGSVDEIILLDNGAERRKRFTEIGLSAFNNDSGFTTNVGDITNVGAGNGLTGGGSSGSVTLNVGAGAGIDVASDSISVESETITFMSIPQLSTSDLTVTSICVLRTMAIFMLTVML